MLNPDVASLPPVDVRIAGPSFGLDLPAPLAEGEPNRIGSAEIVMRHYEPSAPAWATLVWAHGGSFVRGTLDWPEADWVSRRFAEAGVRVYSVDYVLASAQVKSPAPANDVVTALSWALDQYEGPVFVGGASAGANLAVHAALMAVDRASSHAPLAGLILLYPTLHRTQHPDAALTASCSGLAETRRFEPSRIAGMYDFYRGDQPSPAAIVVGELGPEHLAVLPPTVIVNAEFDELRASGEEFAKQLQAAGVRVTEATEPDTQHGYINRPDESEAARARSLATIDRFVTGMHAIVQDPAPRRLVVALPGATLEHAVGEVEGVDFVRWDLREPAPRKHFDIVVPPYMGGTEVLAGLAGVSVGLVQSQSIGYDGVADYLPIGATFANAATVHETSTAELALGLTLAMQRGLPDFVRAGDNARWAPARHASLADRRVLLVGYGGVSQAIEARLAGFEVELTRVARTARTVRTRAGEEVAVHGIDELPGLLALAEIVIVAVPLSDDTRGLFDADLLAHLAEGALLVNVARGPVVDTDALVAELSAGRLRAALDVTDPEPLPADHPLWRCPNLLISPHVGGASSAMIPRMAKLVRRQIGHLAAGEVPENVVLGGA